MKYDIKILKGIAPGKLIERELSKRAITQRALATQIEEHSQTLNAVIVGRRQLTTKMAVKIETALNIPEGFLLTMQAHHNIAQYKRELLHKPTISIPQIRKGLFWDTDFDKIDWQQHKASIIDRVLNYGSEEEKQEITKFYNLDTNQLANLLHKNQYHIHKNGAPL